MELNSDFRNLKIKLLKKLKKKIYK